MAASGQQAEPNPYLLDKEADQLSGRATGRGRELDVRSVEPRQLALGVGERRDVDVGLGVLHRHAPSAQGEEDRVGRERERRDEEDEAERLHQRAEGDDLALYAGPS
mgnify:CR=1 FL=1